MSAQFSPVRDFREARRDPSELGMLVNREPAPRLGALFGSRSLAERLDSRTGMHDCGDVNVTVATVDRVLAEVGGID